MSTSPHTPPTTLHRIQADGVEMFYREAGSPDAPVILLLHGFPASSFQYRELIPLLADRYRVIAPDFPGFGFTEVPSERHYEYSFEALGKTLLAFTEALGLKRYALYLFDYGAPTGLRLALARPERVTAIISQNGNAYEEGLGDAWTPIKAYWEQPNPEHRDALRPFLILEATRGQYVTGAPDPQAVAPESYWLDAALMQRPGNAEIQLDLFLDYRTNVALYPKFQEFFRTFKPPTLAIWGKHDPFFTPPGAEAFRKDNLATIVQLLDAGHFALETNLNEIVAAVRELLAKVEA